MASPRAYLAVLLIPSTLLVLACGDGRQRDGPFERVTSRIESQDADATLGVPAVGCVERQLGIGTLRTVATMAGHDVVRFQDATMGPEVAYILDAGARTIVKVDAMLRVQHVFGGEGDGPGELRFPFAISQVGTDGTVFVADRGRGGLILYDTAGAYLETRLVTLTNVEDMAVSPDSILFSHFVIPELIGSHPTAGWVLSVLRADDTLPSPINELGAGTDRETLVLPGPNRFRLSRHGSVLAVFSPADGVVQASTPEDSSTRFQACLPAALADAYRSQRESYESGRRGSSQQSFPILSDVLVAGDTVFLISALPDDRGRFHLDKFLLDGELIGSLVASFPTQQFSDVRFAAHPYRYMSVDGDGTIRRLELAPSDQ